MENGDEKLLFSYGTVISFFQILIDVSDHLERRLSRRRGAALRLKNKSTSRARWKRFDVLQTRVCISFQNSL